VSTFTGSHQCVHSTAPNAAFVPPDPVEPLPPAAQEQRLVTLQDGQQHPQRQVRAKKRNAWRQQLPAQPRAAKLPPHPWPLSATRLWLSCDLLQSLVRKSPLYYQDAQSQHDQVIQLVQATSGGTQ